MNESKFKIKNVKVFKTLINILAEILIDTKIRLTPSGLSIMQGDPARYRFLILNLESNIFKEYECENEFSFVIEIEKLKQALKTADFKDEIELSLLDKEKKLLLNLIKPDSQKESYIIPFVSKSIFVYKLERSIDELLYNYDVDVMLNPEFLVKMINAGEKCSDILAEISYIKVITLKAYNYIDNKFKIEIFCPKTEKLIYESKDMDIFSFSSKKPIKCSFNLNLFKQAVLPIVPIVDQIKLSLGTDNLLKLEYKLDESCKFTCILATCNLEGDLDEYLIDLAHRSFSIVSYEREKDRKEVLNPEEIVIKDEEISIYFDYPLTNEAIFHFKSKGGFTRLDLFRCVYEGYIRIYKEEEERVGYPGTAPGLLNRAQSRGKYGIWGHHLGELFIDHLTYSPNEKLVSLFVSS